MPQGKTARVWLQGKGGGRSLAKRRSYCRRRTERPPKSRVAYRASLRQALIDDNAGHVNVVVCEADYMALMLGIEHLAPPM